MAMDFPNSPTNGQTYTAPNGLTYVYDSTAGKWTLNLFRYGQVQCNFTALNGQTSFSVPGGYAPGLVQVYKNGLKLINGVSVTVTSGINVVLASGATAGDTIEVSGLQAFTVGAGYFLGSISYLTAASGTYTPPNGCRALLVEAQASGASGGGVAATGVGEAAVSSGGSAGGFARKFITSLAASYAYTVVAPGAAPAAGNNPGNNGGNTTFGTITCTGGIAGVGGANGGGFLSAAPVTGSGATGGDENYTGGNSGYASASVGNVFMVSPGGITLFGPSLNYPTINAAGVAGRGYGQGGSGCANSASQVARAGGVGATGIIKVSEFF